MPLNQNSPIPSDIRPQRTYQNVPQQPTRPPVQSPKFPHRPPTNYSTPPRKSSGKSILGIIIILILLASLYGLYTLGVKNPSQVPPVETTSATTTQQTVKPTSTPPVSSSDEVNVIEQELNATVIDDSDLNDLDKEFE